MANEPLFRREGGFFVPTDRSRGPWNRDFLHGGPVAALLTWAAERECDALGEAAAGFRIARLTADLFRPVPCEPLTLETAILRQGGRVLAIDASLQHAGHAVARGAALLLRASESPSSATADVELSGEPPPDPETLSGGPLGRFEGPPSYAGSVEFRRVRGWDSPPPAISWIRSDAPLFPEEEPSPAVRAAAISDFVNPLANMSPRSPVGFINADITLYLHRPPEGEWHCMVITGRGHEHGIAVGTATLRDRRGPYGRCTLASLANARPPGAIAKGGG